MPRLRFETTRDLFDAFPGAKQALLLEPNDLPSLHFLQELIEGPAVEKAVGFCAYLLPRREAVWWGCAGIKTLGVPGTPAEQAALEVAEQWVKDPEEEHRLSALRVGQASDPEKAATWLALGAGWAGGSMPLEGKSVALPPDQTAKAVRAAVLIAGAYCQPKCRIDFLKQCARDGARLAASEGKD